MEEPEAAEAARLRLVEAVSMISGACRSGCARRLCERLEDLIAAAMDEVEEAAGLGAPPGWLRLEETRRLARALDEAAEELEKRGCREEAGLLREAARRAAMAAALG